MYSLKVLISQPVRLMLTVMGVTLCALLMLFLWAVYSGVERGSVEYVRCSEADIWVLQRNATNILRCSSLLNITQGQLLTKIEDIEEVSPLFFYLATIHLGKRNSTVYLTGYNPSQNLGKPPHIIKGRNVLEDDEIVLDKSTAAKFHFDIGDSVVINQTVLKVVGISEGTNMFVIQYAFVSLRCVQKIAGFPYIVSCFLVKVKAEREVAAVAESIRGVLPHAEVFDREVFLQNNIQEMESGILPLLFIVALIGAVVLTAILSLTLTVNILEQRSDIATMKALGAPLSYIPIFVLKQTLIMAVMGLTTAILVFFPMTVLVEAVAPEVSAKTSLTQMILIAVLVFIISLFSSFLPIRRLRKIYPLEAFK